VQVQTDGRTKLDVVGLVAESLDSPMATGELLLTFCEFEMLLPSGIGQDVRPDACRCDGITCGKNVAVAVVAEANRGVGVPHHPRSRGCQC